MDNLGVYGQCRVHLVVCARVTTVVWLPQRTRWDHHAAERQLWFTPLTLASRRQSLLRILVVGSSAECNGAFATPTRECEGKPTMERSTSFIA